MNLCTFSPDRRHRYSLLHVMRPGGKRIAWIGLNPSTADEQKLDPTLTRIKAFSLAHGFDEFVMLNLFSFRATDPEGMRESGEFTRCVENREAIKSNTKGIFTVFAWGATFNQWAPKLVEAGWCDGQIDESFCLGRTKSGHPRHPLYVHGKTKLEPFNQ